jgi:branched-subunit amino acid transport protein
VVNNVAVGKVFLRVLRFSPVSIIPSILQSHLHLSPTVHNPEQLTASSHNASNKPFLVNTI